MAVASQEQLKEFIVLDVDVDVDHNASSSTAHIGKANLRACNMEIARAADFGRNDERMLVKSHLGGFIQPGDTVLGYEISTLTAGFDETEGAEAPLEVYLVKKPREKKEKKRRAGKAASSAASQVEPADVP